MRTERIVFQHLEAGTFSIAVTRDPRSRSLHAGIVYRDGDGRSFLHYAMHRNLRDDPLAPASRADRVTQDVFIVPDLHEGIKSFLAGFCRLIARCQQNQEIPYAFDDDPEAIFDLANGRITRLVDKKGLTCATFVLKVLQSVSIRLVDRADWPFTPDAEWVQRRLAHYLHKSGCPDQAMIVDAEADRRVPRIGPEHVAGAAVENSDDWPVPHAVCFPNAGSILCMLTWPFDAR